MSPPQDSSSTISKVQLCRFPLVVTQSHCDVYIIEISRNASLTVPGHMDIQKSNLSKSELAFRDTMNTNPDEGKKPVTLSCPRQVLRAVQDPVCMDSTGFGPAPDKCDSFTQRQACGAMLCLCLVAANVPSSSNQGSPASQRVSQWARIRLISNDGRCAIEQSGTDLGWIERRRLIPSERRPAPGAGEKAKSSPSRKHCEA
jgi:hypothetical protein